MTTSLIHTLEYWYPHYYSSLLRAVELQVHKNIVIQVDGRHLFRVETHAQRVNLFTPDFVAELQKNTSYISQQTFILLGSLFLGYELGKLYHTSCKKNLPIKNRDEYAQQFSLIASRHAGTGVYDSVIARKYLKSFSFSKEVTHLFQSYKNMRNKEVVLPFAVEKSSISNAQIYNTIHHASRYACLVIALAAFDKDASDEVKLLVSQMKHGKYPKIFELNKITVASPGLFEITLKKSYAFLKKYLSSVRKSFSALPFLDLYIEREHVKLKADIADQKARKEEAELKLEVTKFTKQQFREYQKRLALPKGIQKLDYTSEKELTQKLLESAEFLNKSKIKISH